MSEKTPSSALEFKSAKEFEEVCRTLAMRLHYLNRVAMGESGFAWATADMLQRLGRTFAEAYDDKDVWNAFGDGWSEGTVAREDRAVALMARMYPED